MSIKESGSARSASTYPSDRNGNKCIQAEVASPDPAGSCSWRYSFRLDRLLRHDLAHRHGSRHDPDQGRRTLLGFV
jgi:hypothetical protein